MIAKTLLRRLWLTLRGSLLTMVRPTMPALEVVHAEVRRILVIRQDRLGDVVLTSAMMPALRQMFPDAEIVYWIREPFLPLFEQEGDFAVTAERPQQPFDLVIDPLLDYPLAGARLAASFRARWSAGFDVAGRGAWFSVPVAPAADDEPFLVSLARLLRPLGWQGDLLPPQLSMTQEERHAARRLTGDEPYILIHPGAFYASQRWPAGHVAALADEIVRSGQHVVMAGSNGDADVLDDVLHQSETKTAVVVRGVPLRMVMALIAEAAVVVCNNSGPLHLAGALGVPTVSTLGPTNPAIWWPVGDSQRVLEAPDCGHCQQGDCNRGCLARITPEQVLGEINSLLEEQG